MPLDKQDIFTSGVGGYHTYRIPTIAVTPRGTLLAFCEGRVNDRDDAGEHHILAVRSEDGGDTWSPPVVIWRDGDNTCGNPCPVVDAVAGRVCLLMTHSLGDDTQRKVIMGEGRGRRTVWLTTSHDDGLSWTPPRNITGDVMPDHFCWYATGPGAGIQLGSGRLVVPCDHKLLGSKQRKDPDVHFSHAIYSDDHGETWQRGAPVGPGANECEAVELTDGRVMLNMRSYRGEGCRLVAVSGDGGETFSDPQPDPTLIEPVCQASIRRFGSRLLFTNPASTSARESLTVRMSEDDGRSWRISRVLQHGPAAYSCLAVLPDGRVVCLYEYGHENPYEKLALARFDMEWITANEA